ncbi:MAG TPA: hypothetical protein VFA59_02565 [Vicinamibacterales bacterium]|nr:hypothetical protein [Vicinamibacterales bacterium]
MVTAILVAGSASAQQDTTLPVSLDKIKEGLEQTPTLRLRGLNEVPTFKVEIHERQKPFALEELLKDADVKPGPIPAGGLYAYEMQRQLWHTSDNPLRQPYAAFSQPQLLTILIENLVGKYLAGKAINAVTSAERAHAEAQARDDVHSAVAEYCSAQPYGGRGIEICTTSIQ